LDFDAGYRRWRASRAHAALFGAGLPPEVEPFSFVPLDGLQTIADHLKVRPGATLVDLGCGRGGPGLWLADRSGARLIGIDGSAVAVTDAQERTSLFTNLTHARFQVADVTNTGLPARCADAVVAIDVVQLVDQPARMLAEAARLLKIPGRLVLTTWEGRGSAPERFPRDLRGLLEGAGLRVTACLERQQWLPRQESIYRRAAELAGSTASDPALVELANEGRHFATWQHDLRRVVAAAQRDE
jgi:SAM-dependent methyltransferase